MTAGRTAWALAFTLGSLAVGACGSRPPAESPGDSRELTCDERARVSALCTRAVAQRCASQGNDCEVGCESHESLPASQSKIPTTLNDEESTRCRDQCRVTRESCMRSTGSRCPQACP